MKPCRKEEKKMKKEIYVVEITWSVDFDMSSTVKAYSSLESAKKELNTEFEQSKIDLDRISDLQIEKDEMAFSVYEDGNYCENHISGEIIITELLDWKEIENESLGNNTLCKERWRRIKNERGIIPLFSFSTGVIIYYI